MLVFDVGCDGSYTNTHRSDEHKGLEVLPTLADIGTADDFCLMFSGKQLT